MRRWLSVTAFLGLLLSMVGGCHHTAGCCDCVEPVDPCMKYECAPILPVGMHEAPVKTMTKAE